MFNVVELIIVDGFLFVDSCQSVMMGATSMFKRKEGHGYRRNFLPLYPGRHTNNIKLQCLKHVSLFDVVEMEDFVLCVFTRFCSA